MSLETNLKGRLRNTSLPASHGLLPLFEAVINSIHAIEETGRPLSRGRIDVEVVREEQQRLFDHGDEPGEAESEKKITGFRISDNGAGFTNVNMKSFLTLDSDYKAEKGGRGVGRLLWLKAFTGVAIESIYKDDEGELKSRSFRFTAEMGVSAETVNDAPLGAAVGTSVYLSGFVKRYRKASLKTVRGIANSLFEHCLWYFIREGGPPRICMIDGDNTVSLSDVYDEHMVSSSKIDDMLIKNEPFQFIHIKLHGRTSNPHTIAFCAANRLVKEESIVGKVPGLYGKLPDDKGEFIYTCYITSPFLDEVVRPERTGFEISDEPEEFFGNASIALSDIKDAALSRAADFLSTWLEENRRKARERVEQFVSRRAPRYRPILPRIAEEKLFVDPAISDKELDLTLHKQLAELEEQLLLDGHDVMKQLEDEEPSEYQNRLEAYLRMAEDIKRSDLANYVSHRRVILDLLEKAIQRKSDGKYAREDVIHKLIMPMGVTSTEVRFDDCNLWIIDESLAFHDYLASDRPLCSMPITGSSDTKEPDLCALNVFDTPVLVAEGSRLPLASIVVVEIKRPMRNDAKAGEQKDPIEQALDYLNRIREGEVTTATGRPIPRSESIPGFCYVICDITPTIQRRCQIHDYTRTSDGMGYFFFHKEFNAYVEISSYDRLVNRAKERNRAFFDKLGLPSL